MFKHSNDHLKKQSRSYFGDDLPADHAMGFIRNFSRKLSHFNDTEPEEGFELNRRGSNNLLNKPIKKNVFKSNYKSIILSLHELGVN